jgi:AcrR family transcriptional regulator
MTKAGRRDTTVVLEGQCEVEGRVVRLKNLSLDHRSATAKKKREEMHSRILAATQRVFVKIRDDAPVIEDVVREANISRGTFYTHFNSLDQAYVAAGLQAQDDMMRDIWQLHDCLKEPWERAAVGFRVFMVRASQDPLWASFVMRLDTWQRESRLGHSISRDLEGGRDAGYFSFKELTAATEFVMGASAATVQALRRGVVDPEVYMETAHRMLFSSLGASADLTDRAVAFSRKHLYAWESGELQAWAPLRPE